MLVHFLLRKAYKYGWIIHPTYKKAKQGYSGLWKALLFGNDMKGFSFPLTRFPEFSPPSPSKDTGPKNLHIKNSKRI
jgi:hypothetical protein